MFAETTATKRIKALDKKIRAVCGGTSASKTISILLYLIARCQTDATPTLTSVTSESFPHLKRGAMRDFKNIMQAHHYWKDRNWNASDSVYTFETGSKLEFFSMDQADKLRGARRDRGFMNEANNGTLDAFDQLEVRTKEFFFLDWNPTNEFWFYTDVLGQREDVDFITLTYKDNEALSPEIVSSIESRKNRKGWWKVYGLGQLGEVEGKIYKDWKIIDEVPHEAELVRYGLDFGYSCLKGDTLVKTINGDKRIDEIKIGEKVLTRQGYKKVSWSGSKGFKEVYSVDFGLDKRIIVTGDHLIYTKNGWKEVSNLSNKETICELKQSSTGEFIKDTLTENTQTISTTKVEKKTGYCIGIFMKRILERYRKVFVYTTLTKTLLTISQKILLQFQIVNITRYTTQTTSERLQSQKCKRSGQGFGLQKIIGKKEEESQWKQRSRKLRNVLNVVKKSCLLTHIKSFADQYAGKELTQGTAKKNILVRSVEKFLSLLLISKETHVLKNVRINSRLLKEKVEVFDLTVEGEHEFFANGVLVHNCDPTAIVAIYKYMGGFIVDEITFLTGLKNKQIADILLDQENTVLTVADNEQKSVDTIKDYGVNILSIQKKVPKGKIGPTKTWKAWKIDVVQSQRMSVTKRSTNIIKEYRNYLWKVDKDGRIINEPEHIFSHSMNAIEYAIVSLVGKKVDNKTTVYRPKVLDPYA